MLIAYACTIFGWCAISLCYLSPDLRHVLASGDNEWMWREPKYSARMEYCECVCMRWVVVVGGWKIARAHFVESVVFPSERTASPPCHTSRYSLSVFLFCQKINAKINVIYSLFSVFCYPVCGSIGSSIANEPSSRVNPKSEPKIVRCAIQRIVRDIILSQCGRCAIHTLFSLSLYLAP